MERVPIAVIGAGYWGSRHAAKLAAMPGVEVVAVVDPQLERARAAATGDTLALDDARDVIGRVRAAVVVCPTTLHHEVAAPLLDAGVDVLVEKPITPSVDEADDLIARAARRGALLQVGHLERFNPVVQAVRSHVGHPLFLVAERLGPFAGRADDVDVVLDLMIHDLDLMLTWVSREVRMVHAVGVGVVTANVDIASARLEFEGGCVANLTASRTSVERTRKVRIFQASGYLSLDLAAHAVSGIERDPVSGELHPAALEIPVRDALEDELESFVAAVRTRRAPVVDGAAGRAALELALAILAAMADHRARVSADAIAGAVGETTP